LYSFIACTRVKMLLTGLLSCRFYCEAIKCIILITFFDCYRLQKLLFISINSLFVLMCLFKRHRNKPIIGFLPAILLPFVLDKLWHYTSVQNCSSYAFDIQGCTCIQTHVLRSNQKAKLDVTGVFGSMCKREIPYQLLNMEHEER
jgi:hypothetical protein